MKNLLIGNSSQLAHYFPNDGTIKISSRNINFDNYKQKYDKVIIAFAEQRTFIQDDEKLFLDTNVNYTLSVIDHFSKYANNVVVYGTCELWNNCEGPIDITTPFRYNYSPYIYSKHSMVNEIEKERRKGNYKNVIIIHPFNFNSPYRKGGFLFGKIFKSIINKEKIEIGDTYFYRDLVHPSEIVNRSLIATRDEVVGSGRLTMVKDFIVDLYESSFLKYEDYVTENFDHNLKLKRKIFYYNKKERVYNDLIKLTIHDIKRFKGKLSK